MQASRAQSSPPRVNRVARVTGSLLSNYKEIRRATLQLARPFSAEDQMLQSMAPGAHDLVLRNVYSRAARS